MDIPGITPEFLHNYQRLCQSPLRDTETITNDLRALMALPHVKYVGFKQTKGSDTPDTLMIGTDMVKIKNGVSGRYHDIGEFIIFLTRRREGRVWVAEYHLSNTCAPIINSLQPTDEWLVGQAMHPHMTTQYNERLECWVAAVCIEQGFFAIYQHIRRGELCAATQLILTLLHSHEKEKTFPGAELYQWPLSKENMS